LPDNWNYHTASCTPGQSVTVQANRTSSAMDPAMTVCSGNLCGVSNSGWGFGTCPAGSAPLGTGDDNNGIPCGLGGSFADPLVTFTCPASGVFTVAIFGFSNLTPTGPLTYNFAGTG